MSAQTIRRTQTRIARFDLGAVEWLVLRAALLARAGGTTPRGFASADLGHTRPLSRDERARAWESLCERGLATHVPAVDQQEAIAPRYLPALCVLTHPDVRLDAGSWHGDVVVDRAVSWTASRTASLTRRRAIDSTAGLDPEGTVELALSWDAVLLGEVMRALPARNGPATAVLPSPVRVDGPGSAEMAHALSAEPPEVAAHLSFLPPYALAAVAASPLVGGASVSGSRGPGTGGFHGVWLWTDSQIVELADTCAGGVVLRPTDVTRVRTGVVSALTELLSSSEAL